MRPVAAISATIVSPTIGGEPWTPAQIAHLGRDLDASLAAEPSVRGAHVGVLAIDTASGTVLYDRRGDEAFQPASTLKLVVGSVALERLGPAFAWSTRAYVLRAIAAVGTSAGTPPGAVTFSVASLLVVDVSGDPLFSLADVDALVAAVRKLPRTTLRDVVIRTFPRVDPYPAGWTFDDLAQDYAPPISAATLEENVVHVRVRPGPAAGDVTSLDVGSNLPLLAGDDAACSSEGAFLLDAAMTVERGAPATVDADVASGGCRRVIGTIGAASAPVALDVAVPNPASYLARTIVAALRAAGVPVAGSGSVTTLPTRLAGSSAPALPPAVWEHVGVPLRNLMPRFWIPSDNFVGEQLLMALQANDGDRSRDASLAIEREWLRSIGVDPTTTTLADGSGLSQYDRITPRDLVTILQHDWNGPNRQLVLDSLPVGGARGTIEGIAGTSAAGRVFAKTGSMMHVRGLAGYLATTHHGAVTFAFEVDDWLGDYPSLAAVRAAVLSRIVSDGDDRAPAP